MFFRISAASVVMTALFAQSPAEASPVGVGLLEPPAIVSLVQRVHGCHRSAQDGVRGWHRHVGRYCRTVRSGPSQRNPYASCRTRCQYVGPIKQCRRVCR